MSRSVACPACGRRLKLPDDFAATKARCPGCRTKFNPLAPAVPDLAAKAAAAPLPPPVALPPLPPAPRPRPAVADRTPVLPPPVPVAPVVKATPTPPAPAPLSLDDAEPLSLDDDAPEVEPVSDRWLLWVAAALAAGAAAGPLALGTAAEVGFAAGLAVAAAAALVALGAGAAVVFRTRLEPGAKVGVMAGVAAAVAAAALLGLGAYLRDTPAPAEEPPPGPAAPPPAAPPTTPPPPPPTVVEPGPPTHIDLAMKDGTARIDDGPAEVTALAMAPAGDVLVVGYANGTTRLIDLAQPAFESPQVGPKADGPVRRIASDPTGRVLYLTCTGGVAAGLRDRPTAPAVKLPGDPVAVFAEPGKERFAALRGNKVLVREVPLKLVRESGGRKAVKGFVVPTTGKGGDEVAPPGITADLTPPPGGPTFLAWHPTGMLLAGAAKGVVVTWPAGGARPETIAAGHKAAVRAWAAAAGTWDFATGDDDGVVGVWADKALKPATFQATNVAVAALAFDEWGSRLAVSDAGGDVAVWELGTNKTVYVRKWPGGPPKAVAFGPAEDVLLVSDGKGVEVIWLPAAKR